jgi:endonuclease/exonuclease/phosphatase family metal-dependent hydrolase
MTLRGSFSVIGLAVLSGACSLSPDMERAVPTGVCPGDRFVGFGPGDTTSVRWYRASEDRDNRLSSRWCATVGEAVLHFEPRAEFAPWERGVGVEVASWNMQINGGDLYGFMAGEFGLDCSGEHPRIEAGRPPFVLLLQEAWRYSDELPFTGSGRHVPWTIDEEQDAWDPAAPRPVLEGEHDIVETAEACGLSLVYVPSARNGPDTGERPREDKGNAILSSLPLSTPIALDLPLEGGRKVAVAATILAPGGERVRVVSAHLDVASTLVRALVSGNQTRARQARGLIDGLARAERDGPGTEVVVVGGDFNAWVGNETTLKLMRQAFPESPPWDGLGTRGSFPPDHMYFRRGSSRAFTVESYERIGELYGSDHNARRLRLRYAPVGG